MRPRPVCCGSPGYFSKGRLVIGQSLNKFTPLQLACYASALANKGTRYEATLLSRVVSWDYQDLIEESKPVVASTLEISEKALNALDQGMRMTASIGTAEQYLRDYPIAIACKTGTAQWQGTTSTGSFSGSDHASFVLYAPADDPEIAIAVYVEKGAQGGNLANVCIPILDYLIQFQFKIVGVMNISFFLIFYHLIRLLVKALQCELVIFQKELFCGDSLVVDALMEKYQIIGKLCLTKQGDCIEQFCVLFPVL